MKKYYLMAIELGNVDAINNLAIYYEDAKDYAEMEKYYLKGIKLDNATSMKNLICHHVENTYRVAAK